MWIECDHNMKLLLFDFDNFIKMFHQISTRHNFIYSVSPPIYLVGFLPIYFSRRSNHLWNWIMQMITKSAILVAFDSARRRSHGNEMNVSVWKASVEVLVESNW